MKKRINIQWTSMTGMGPRAWDRDEEHLSIHVPHEHHEEHHIVHSHQATGMQDLHSGEGKNTDNSSRKKN